MDFTLIVPTFNRHDWLRSLVTYLAHGRMKGTLLVLDSSNEEVARKNRQLIDASSLDAKVQSYSETISFREKLVDGFTRVKATYCSMCADDDLVVPSAIASCVEFLDAHQDHVGAQGLYFAFSQERMHFFVDDVVYDHPSIDAEGPVERLKQLFDDYQSNFYAVYRTGVQAEAIAKAAANESLLFFELAQSALTAIRGKIARLPLVYAGRRRSPSAGNPKHWHPVEWVAVDPADLFRHYDAYRNRLLEFMGLEENKQVSELRVLDLIHLHYLLTSIHESGLRAAIASHLERSSREEIVTRAFMGAAELPGALASLPASPFWRSYLQARAVARPLVEVSRRVAARLDRLRKPHLRQLRRERDRVVVEVNAPIMAKMSRRVAGELDKTLDAVFDALFLYSRAP